MLLSTSNFYAPPSKLTLIVPYLYGRTVIVPPPSAEWRAKNQEMQNAFDEKTNSTTKTKHMIIEQNAEFNVAPAQPLPEFESSIQNQKSKIKNVDGQMLLNDLESLLQKYVVLPTFAPETLALWVLHTYAFELRDVSTYLGVESPEKRCGKTTLLSVLNRLVNRPVAAANISPSAFFRVIEEMRPTLLIDEADTFLRGNDEIRGILNAGYTRDTAYVVRVTQADANGLPLPKGEGWGMTIELRRSHCLESDFSEGSLEVVGAMR
jgi:hypothetical protein